jgi:hypothetical protein
MHKIVESVLLLLPIIWLVRRGRVARAIHKSGDRQVWSNASDARFPRFPTSRNPFSRKKGLK